MKTADGIEVEVGKSYWVAGDEFTLPYQITVKRIHRPSKSDPFAFASIEMVREGEEKSIHDFANQLYADASKCIQEQIKMANAVRESMYDSLEKVELNLYALQKEIKCKEM